VAVVDAAPAAEGAHSLYLRRDVRDFEQATEAVHDVEEKLGPVSMLVACAGIRRDAASWKMSEDFWREVIEVDLTGCFTYARAVSPRMRDMQRGRIVLVSSVNGLRGRFGQANYAAAKAGLIGLGKTLARELGPKGITVNVIAPGMIRGGMSENLEPKFIEEARQNTVLGHLGELEDIAAATLFLCSELARHITGEVLRVDGGEAI
jgi:acetoacetyl-CoA reductase/3-oxoacyl-[acyl-carrier protein] reductase